MSFLSKLGSDLKKVLRIGVEAAEIAEPVVDILDPVIAPLYTSAVGIAVAAEAMSLTGTPEQRLAQFIAAIVPQAEAVAAKNGIVWPVAEINKWAEAIYATLTMIPAPTVPAAPATA